MKKAGLMAVIFTSLAFAFTVPTANAEQGEVIAPRGNVVVGPNHVNNNGLDRAADRVGTGVNRAANTVERGMERTFGVRDVDGYNTNVNRTDAGRNRMMNQANYRANAAADDDAFDWGWLGLLGLLGLAGMRGRDRERNRT